MHAIVRTSHDLHDCLSLEPSHDRGQLELCVHVRSFTAPSTSSHDLYGSDSSHVTSLVLHLCHVCPSVSVHVILLHAAQLLQPVKPSHRHDVVIQHSRAHTGPRTVHGTQRHPAISNGIVPLQSGEVALFVVSSEDVDVVLEGDSPHGAPSEVHVRGHQPAVLRLVVALHSVQEHARMTASDGVDVVSVRGHPWAVATHAHAGNGFPLSLLGAEPLGRTQSQHPILATDCVDGATVDYDTCRGGTAPENETKLALLIKLDSACTTDNYRWGKFNSLCHQIITAGTNRSPHSYHTVCGSMNETIDIQRGISDKE